MHTLRALIAFVGVSVFVFSAPTSAEAPAGATACSGCHATAPGIISPVPRLAGMDAAETVKAMQEFRANKRPATVMDRIARGFTDDEIRAIADWYARQR